MDRIDGTNPLSTSRTQAGQPPADAPTRADGRDRAEALGGKQDRLAVSDRARLVAEASSVVRDTVDVREARVAELRAAIADGSYKPDAGEVARRLLASGFGED